MPQRPDKHELGDAVDADEAAKKGDLSRSTLYMRYRGRLQEVAYGILHDRHLAEDVVQDVFLSLIRTRGIGPRPKLRLSYLIACTVNRSINVVRGKKSLSNITHAYKEVVTPASLMILKEDIQQLKLDLAKLPKAQLEVIQMRSMLDLSFKEISDRQGINVATVKARFQRGMRKLKCLMRRSSNEES